MKKDWVEEVGEKKWRLLCMYDRASGAGRLVSLFPP